MTTGYTPTDNALFVLKDQYRNRCRITATYTEDEKSRVLSAVERSSAIDKRDYLILLPAAEYGWRSGGYRPYPLLPDRLEQQLDIILPEQNGLPVEYSLLSSVGNAIIDYLRHNRSNPYTPEVIVSAEAGKHGAPLNPPTLHFIVVALINPRYIRTFTHTNITK